MGQFYMLDFHLSSAKFCLIELATSYKSAYQDDPYFRHAHHAYEIHYIEEGSCKLRVGEQQYLLQEGDLCLIAPNVYHSQKIMSNQNFDRISLSFKLNVPEKRQLDDETRVLIETLQSAHFFHFPAKFMNDLFHRMKDAAINTEEKIGGMLKLKALVELVLIELLQHINNLKTSTMTTISSLDQRRGVIIDEFFHYQFQINNGNRILADKLGLTNRQLDRVLKKIYGKGFREMLLEMRLEVAKDLLYTTDKSIADIAEITGYMNIVNFSSFIKKMTGKTPTTIRREKDAI
jgi:YesN/AraC family two-component response regulator